MALNEYQAVKKERKAMLSWTMCDARRGAVPLSACIVSWCWPEARMDWAFTGTGQ